MKVAFGTTTPEYCSAPPFHPGERYPELAFSEVSATPNPAYALLRELWLSLGLDRRHAETSKWNPLGDYIQPGDTVLLKPNYVIHSNGSGGDIFAVVTHPSILRALVDYAFLALQGRGRIVIADGPEMSCQWEDLMAVQLIDSIQAFYRGRFDFPIELLDLRDWSRRGLNEPVFARNRVPLPGDPAGHTIINLGTRSAFHGMPSQDYYGADYDRTETIRHHHDEVHEYCISNTFLQADVVLSVPKMKVHKKVGVTLNLKGLVGVNTNKNFLIHYRIGSPRQQGDQLPDNLQSNDRWHIRVQRWLYDHTLARQDRVGDAAYAFARGFYQRIVRPFWPISRQTRVLDGGNWHGNDSAWRMTADLAKILYFADRQGALQSTLQRRIFCVVDGIIAGESDGPLAPTAKSCGCLVAGDHPYAVDMVTARLMGFDPRKIRQFSTAFDPAWNFGLRSFDDIEICEGGRTMPGREFFAPERRDPHFGLAVHVGWKGQIEV